MNEGFLFNFELNFEDTDLKALQVDLGDIYIYFFSVVRCNYYQPPPRRLEYWGLTPKQHKI